MSFLALCVAAVLGAAEIPFTGTWLGDQPAIASGTTVVIAVFDRNGTCCGGPVIALAGLVGLRDSLKDRAGMLVVAVDATAGVTAETAKAAVGEHKLDGIPLLVDPTRGTGTALQLETDVTMRYVIAKPDGSRQVCTSPAQVRKALVE